MPITEETKPPKTGPGGAPKHNQNARKSGFHAAKAALSEFGQKALDGRSAMARGMGEFRESLIADLGGIAALSAGKRVILDKAVVTKLLLDGIDNHLVSKGSAVMFSNRGRSLSAIVRERQVLADSLVRQLQVLGLDRVAAATPSLKHYAATNYPEKSK